MNQDHIHIICDNKNLKNKQPAATRLISSEILVQLYKSKTPVKTIVDQAVKTHRLPGNDRSLVMQLVYGVLRNRQYLDRIIEILSRTPLHKLDPFIHQALAVGLYQIFSLDRIPDSAAVNEAVESCRVKKIRKHLLGFVNGVLRQAIRQKDKLALKAATTDDGKPIVNHPQWLVARWQQNFGGPTAERICSVNSREPSLTLRVNTGAINKTQFCRNLTEAGIGFKRGSYAPEALALQDYHGPVNAIPGFEDGHFLIQDEAAQLATPLLGPFRKNGHYLDGCAGLGGKTMHLLQLGEKEDFTVHAVEPEKSRMKRLQENTTRLFPQLKPGRLEIHENHLQDIRVNNGTLYNGILIDAPCSGTGVAGRHPDIRWNRSFEDIQKNQKRQLELLAHAAKLLAPDGILVYATCSIEPEENQDVIDTFLSKNEGFLLTDCSLFLPGAAKNLVRDNFFCPLPEEGIDGFFAARLVKS